MNVKILFEQMYQAGKVSVGINTHSPNIQIPEQLKNKEQIVLAFSARFQLPKFEISDLGICAVLSFNKQPFEVFIPWEDVLFLQNEELNLATAPFEMPTKEEELKKLKTKKHLGLVVFNPEIVTGQSDAALALVKK